MQRIPLYSKLMELPMFQGMSKDDLMAVIGQTRFDFAQKEAGETIANAGDECAHLSFLLSGQMEVPTTLLSLNLICLTPSPHKLKRQHVYHGVIAIMALNTASPVSSLHIAYTPQVQNLCKSRWKNLQTR